MPITYLPRTTPPERIVHMRSMYQADELRASAGRLATFAAKSENNARLNFEDFVHNSAEAAKMKGVPRLVVQGIAGVQLRMMVGDMKNAAQTNQAAARLRAEAEGYISGGTKRPSINAQKR